MLISVRDAARLLADVGLTFDQTRLLLRTGVAGPGTRVGTALAYDADTVAGLVAWPEVDPDAVLASLPAGLYVARLARVVEVDLTGSWAAAAAMVSDQPPMTPMSRALLSARIAGHGSVPWVATMFGFVLLGAEAIRVWSEAEGGRTCFALQPPGRWWRGLEGRRLRTRGGCPGLLLTARPTAALRSGVGG